MKSDEELLQEFSDMSVVVGADPAYVQGGGGNTSLKLDSRRMVIKASGWRLGQVTPSLGYTVVDYVAMRRYLLQLAAGMTELTEDKPITDFVLQPQNFRPSMETGFHALLGSAVLHSHSVYANVLTCAMGGQAIVGQMFPQSLWIDYVTPGMDLSLTIQQALQNEKREMRLIFLRNHGIIISGDNSTECTVTHQVVNEQIRRHLDLPIFNLQEVLPLPESRLEQYLFPDQVIYLSSKKESPDSLALRETVAAYSYIVQQIERLKWVPNYLQNEDVQALLGLESENYRKTQIT